jgi:micrococcal nuclease
LFWESLYTGFPRVSAIATEKPPNMQFKNLLKWLPLLIILGLISVYFAHPNFAKSIANKGAGEFKKVGNHISGQNSENSKLVKIVKVSDGDTVKLESGENIRFCGIDAPEKSQPRGPESTAALQKLVDSAKGEAFLVEVDRDRYGRIVGELFIRANDRQQPEREINLNSEQIRTGNAYFYKQFSKCPNREALEMAETIAQRAKVGVYSGDYQKPWDYRKAQRNSSKGT